MIWWLHYGLITIWSYIMVCMITWCYYWVISFYFIYLLLYFTEPPRPALSQPTPVSVPRPDNTRDNNPNHQPLPPPRVVDHGKATKRNKSYEKKTMTSSCFLSSFTHIANTTAKIVVYSFIHSKYLELQKFSLPDTFPLSRTCLN